MKCWKCGKEIPDDRKFCGYCGAEVKTDEKETSVLKDEKKEEPVSVEETSDNKDTSVEKSVSSDTLEKDTAKVPSKEDKKEAVDKQDETESEESPVQTDESKSRDADATVKEESSEKNDSNEDTEEETLTEEIPSDKEESSSEEPIAEDSEEEKKESEDTSDVDSQESSEETVMDSDPNEDTQNISMPDDTQDAEFTKAEDTDKEEKKWKMPDLSEYGITINAEDFRRVFDKIRKPLEDHPFNGVSAVISFIVMWIIDWIAFRSFGTGFIITAVLVIGVMILMAVENHDQFNWQKAFNQSCETVVSGALPLIIGGILLDSASGQASYSFIHLFSTSFFGMFFILLAGIIFVSEIFRTRKFNKYAEVVLTALIILVVLWIASASNPEAFISLFH